LVINPNTKPGLSRQKAPSFVAFILIGLVIALIYAVNYYTSANSRNISPALMKLSFLVYPLAAVIVVFIIKKFRKDQKYVIASVEALHGYFLMDKVWALSIGLPAIVMCLGTAANGYYSLAIPFAFILVLDVAASLYFKRGLKIDKAGNIYYVKQSNEMLIDFKYLKEVSFIHHNTVRRYELTFIFDNKIKTDLPSKIIIIASKLIATDYKTPLNHILLGEFIKSKCSNAGFIITELNPDYEDNQWRAVKN
jgi:hypothetical protein